MCKLMANCRLSSENNYRHMCVQKVCKVSFFCLLVWDFTISTKTIRSANSEPITTGIMPTTTSTNWSPSEFSADLKLSADDESDHANEASSASCSLPLPKEVWWILESIYLNIEDQLNNFWNKDNPQNLDNCDGVDFSKPKFCLGEFLVEPQNFEELDLEERRLMRTVRDCVEFGIRIPATIPVSALLRVCNTSN